MNVIGLDFGTGNSVLAVHSGGEVRVVCGSWNDGTTPSDVLVGPDGAIDADPEHLVHPPPSFRRVRALKRALLSASNQPDTLGVALADLAVARLQYLYQRFGRLSSEPPTKAVLTCPANAGQAYRDLLLDIGRRVGLPQVSIVDEPTAAAVHHGLSEVAAEDERWLVVDWGCGTCDISLIERSAGYRDLDVRCVRGLNTLGGLDMDTLLRNRLAEQYHFESESLPLWEVEELKKRLSQEPSAAAQWALPDGRKVDVRLTRAELDNVIDPLLSAAQKLIREALDEAGWSDVDRLLAIGGPMLMPAVRRAVSASVDWEEEDILWQDPLTSVAKGAARLAEFKRVGGLVVTNPVAQSIGVRVRKNGNDDSYHRIVQRGETRPVTRQVVLSTSVDLQDVITIELREGDFDSAQSNTLLGTLNVVVRPENRRAIKLALSVRLTDSSDKEVWLEPVGDQATVRQLQPIGITVGRDVNRPETKEQRWSDPIAEFEAKTAGREVDPDTVRQEYERLKIKYHPDRYPERRSYWSERLAALDQAFNAYQTEIARRIRASTQPDLPWHDASALKQIPVDEVLAQRLTHCLAMSISGPATPAQLTALLTRCPDYRRVLASYLYSLKRNAVLQTLIAEDDRPHVGLVVLLQNLPDKPIRERHEVLKAAYRLSHQEVRRLLATKELDIEQIYRHLVEDPPPLVRPFANQGYGGKPAAGPVSRQESGPSGIRLTYERDWTWVYGEVGQFESRLRAAGFSFSRKRGAWFATRHVEYSEIE